MIELPHTEAVYVPRTCLAIQPCSAGELFPAICRQSRGHVGPHRSASSTFNSVTLRNCVPIEWDNDGTEVAA